MFSWWRDRRRREITAAPFPVEWRRILGENVRCYAGLSSQEQTQLCDDLRIFMAEKNWEGCGGLILTDEIQITISAYACLLTLHLTHDFYPNVESILVYPTAYVAMAIHRGSGGVIDESPSPRAGEAWTNGPVVLAWADVLSGGENPGDGRNVALHEFAHKLDFRDGVGDGVPRLKNDDDYEEWSRVMTREFADLVESARSGRPTFLDEYGATDAAEFFAVATEFFFEKPREMLRRHKELYKALRGFYGQDTAARA